MFGLFAAAALQFTPQTIATDLKGGYQVVAVDMNKDGRPDLLALASGMSELVWYENPTWQRHVIVSDVKRMINVWPMDVDKDGVPELLLAHAFENEAARSVGIVSYLHFDGKGWTIREIDRLTTSHRLRSANGLFINSPLTGASAVAPEYRDHTLLVAYAPPDFQRRQISVDDEGVVHGIFIHDWNRDGLDDVLTASFKGIWVNLAHRDGTWTPAADFGGRSGALAEERGERCYGGPPAKGAISGGDRALARQPGEHLSLPPQGVAEAGHRPFSDRRAYDSCG